MSLRTLISAAALPAVRRSADRPILRRAATTALSLLLAGCAAARVEPPSVIPAPARIVPVEGAFELDERTAIAIADPGDAELRRVAEMWAAPVRAFTGFPLPVGTEGSIRLEVEEGSGAPESYRLEVGAERIRVRGADHAGLFYGLQTLAQLLPPGVADGGGAAAMTPESGRPGGSGPADALPTRRPAGAEPIRIAAVDVEDEPRFSWRGMHLDVGRHFYGPEFVKRYIDMLARYKINRFHWHLTEDQGWRIQIDAYPRLTEVGAWRSETHVGHARTRGDGDGQRYGGFYTKDEIRDVVAYAAERYVTVVPEIEMPGHSSAALAAYPELACTEGPFEVATTWGIFEDIYCPEEETFAFLEAVLTEVMELFPGEWIHIGGDEAPKARWEQSEVAQQVIEREGLADEHELQSWFIRRIERFLSANGRRLIGWDEILEGGLAPGATVMSWRGTAGGIDAARAGHDVVMTPNSHLYFDYYQSADTAAEPLAIGGFLPLERVYEFEPVPVELTEQEARHVLGAQANVWTEYMKTEDHVEYMVFPRMFALSEIAWSPREAKDFGRFYARLGWHLERLDALGIDYRIPDVRGLNGGLVLEDRPAIALAAPVGRIRYTTDGRDPDRSSNFYYEPVGLDLRGGPVTLAARVELPDGRLGPVRRARYERTEPRAAAMVDSTRFEPGWRVETFQGRFIAVERMARERPVRRDPAAAVAIPEWAPAEPFGLRFRGFLRVPRTGIYTFRLTSDDGSVLRITNRVVVDHDGRHGATTRSAQVALAEGFHPIEVEYFQIDGRNALSLTWRGGGETWEAVDESVVARVR